MRKLLFYNILLTLFCWISTASAEPSNINRIKMLFPLANRLTSGNGGQFTMSSAGTLHFFKTYFYSDSGCSTLMTNGVASLINSGSGMALNNGHTYTLDGSSVYQLANNRGLTTGSIGCIQVYLDGGNNSSNGVSCMNFAESCSGSSCASGSTNTATWAASPTVCVTRYSYLLSNSVTATQIQKCTVSGTTVGSSCTGTGPSLATGSLGNFFNNGYGYFSSKSGSNIFVTSCSMDPSNSGAVSNTCTSNSIADVSSTYTFREIAVSTTYAYVLSGSSTAGSGQLDVCSISSTTGALTGCTAVISASDSLLSDPRGIVINNGYLYITNNNGGYPGNPSSIIGSILQCNVSGSSVTGCSLTTNSTTASPVAAHPRGVTTYNGYLYFVNSLASGSANTGQVVVCAINSGDGSLGSCSQTGINTVGSPAETDITNTANYQGITISNGYAYFVNSNATGVGGPSNAVAVCTVESSGILDNCQLTGPATLNLVSMSIY